MRINKYVALATGMSRRAADKAISENRVRINGQTAALGADVSPNDNVTLDNRNISTDVKTLTVMLNKPAGYVCSRDGQGSKTVYDLLPPELHHLKPVGRLDKDSSGLLLLTNDGTLAHELTHPSFQKEKIYEVELNKPLQAIDFEAITAKGVDIGDLQLSKFLLAASSKVHVASSESIQKNPCYFLPATCYWRATLAEGRNRQIRRTFAALGYTVTKLHRTRFGPYKLHMLKSAQFVKL